MVSLGAAMSLAALGVSAFLAAYVLGMRPREPANRAFFVLMVSFMIWDGSEAVVRAMPPGTPDATVYPWLQVLRLGIVLVPAGLIHVALAYPEPRAWLRRPWALPAIYAPVAAWAYLIFGTDLAINGVSANAFGPAARVGTQYAATSIVFGAWLYFAVALFVAAWWRSRKGSAGPVQAVVAAGLLLGAIPAGITELFWPLVVGADTRVGLGSMYTLGYSVFIAYAVARYRYLVIEPVVEARAARAARHSLERGMNYLVLESGRGAAMGAFREIVSTTPGLCVTAAPPARIEGRFGLERTPILWITTTAAGGLSVRPSAQDFELLHTVTKFLRENPGTAVLLDDLDYLAELNGFDAVARFVRRVTNQASAAGGTAILAAGHGTFDPVQLGVLRGAVDHVLEVLPAPHEMAMPEGDPVLLLVSGQDAPEALAAAGARAGLLLTTEHPTKARRRFGGDFEIAWITEGGDAVGPRIHPTSLDAEGRRTLTQFTRDHGGADVVIVGLEQLALYNDFRAILGFVKDALDLTSLGNCRLFVTLSPDAFPARDLAMLLRRFDAPAPPGPAVRRPLPSGPSTTSPESRILYRGPVS